MCTENTTDVSCVWPVGMCAIGILTFWNSGGLSFSSSTITEIGTVTKLSFSESANLFTRSFIETRNDSVSCVCNIKIEQMFKYLE